MQSNTRQGWQIPWTERRLAPPERQGDVRSPWDRDYARIIHSAAFRRLQSKTQVMDLGQSDFYRTRLTHSMEVAQVSSGMIKHLIEKHQGEDFIYALPDERLISAICLAHDLGHPPYGHGGEIALNFCMRDYGGFEGNGQTLRILSLLEQYTPEHGLNPTRRLLLGILKYPAPYSTLVNEKAYGTQKTKRRWLFDFEEQKPPKCYLDSEQAVVNWIFNPLGKASKQFSKAKNINTKKAQKHKKTIHMSLDASIMNLSDDISYALHDLEDSVALGLLTRDMWEDYISGKEDVFTACGFSSQEVANDIFSQAEYLRKGRIGGLIHYMITHTLIEESGINSDCPLINYRATFDSSAEHLQKLMGALVFDLVISSTNLRIQEMRGRKIVVDLFDVISSNPKSLLPPEIKKNFIKQKNERDQMRIICDYIACMSDASATRLHEKFFFAGKGSIFDKL